MATKIRLKRMGKKFYAFYRVVITDSRNKRDGQSIEEIGTYNPNTQPSTIQIDSERAQYWLGVGAQPPEPVLKLLKSAAANAENNHQMDPEKLYVSQVFACPGPIIKRMMPRAQGRAYRINKRTSHITIAVAER